MTKSVCMMATILLLGGQAVAEDGGVLCDQLDKIVKSASQGFVDLRGEASKGESAEWTALIAVRGSADCIVVGDRMPSYACTIYAGDSDEEARIAFADYADQIGKCLGEGWEVKNDADAARSQRTFQRKSDGVNVQLSSQIGRADAYTVRLTVGSPSNSGGDSPK